MVRHYGIFHKRVQSLLAVDFPKFVLVDIQTGDQFAVASTKANQQGLEERKERNPQLSTSELAIQSEQSKTLETDKPSTSELAIQRSISTSPQTQGLGIRIRKDLQQTEKSTTGLKEKSLAIGLATLLTPTKNPPTKAPTLLLEAPEDMQHNQQLRNMSFHQQHPVLRHHFQRMPGPANQVQRMPGPANQIQHQQMNRQQQYPSQQQPLVAQQASFQQNVVVPANQQVVYPAVNGVFNNQPVFLQQTQGATRWVQQPNIQRPPHPPPYQPPTQHLAVNCSQVQGHPQAVTANVSPLDVPLTAVDQSCASPLKTPASPRSPRRILPKPSSPVAIPRQSPQPTSSPYLSLLEEVRKMIPVIRDNSSPAIQRMYQQMLSSPENSTDTQITLFRSLFQEVTRTPSSHQDVDIKRVLHALREEVMGPRTQVP